MKNDHRETWKLINKILNRGSKADSLPEYMNTSKGQITTNQEIVDTLKKHFAAVGAKLSQQIGVQQESFTNYLIDNKIR